jgi:hypothetical protein
MVELPGTVCRLENHTASSLQAHDWEQCCSPRRYPGLEDGAYVFSVMAFVGDPMDLTGRVADSRYFLVDTSPPVTELRGDLSPLPAEWTQEDRAEFYFSARGESTLPLTFECSLELTGEGSAGRAHPDVHGFRACESPIVYTGLSGGHLKFTVRATDGAGNVDTSPPSHSWELDVNGLQTFITEGPPAISNTSTVRFAFRGEPDDESSSGVTFECQLLTLPILCAMVAFAPCVSPAAFEALADGRYEFRVRAVRMEGSEDGEGSSGGSTRSVDGTPATYPFAVNTVVPVVNLTRTPAAFASSNVLTFLFDGVCELEDCTFECALYELTTDVPIHEPYACTSPQVCVGGHVAARVRLRVGAHKGSGLALTTGSDEMPLRTDD